MLPYPRMDCALLKSGLLALVMGTAACVPMGSAPAPPSVMPGQATRQVVAERLTAVIVTSRGEIGSWVNRRFDVENAPNDADGGSAAPITADGYFLTADHVLTRAPGKNIFLIYRGGGSLRTAKARIVWRSKADDIAVLHVPLATPYYYRWTEPSRWLSPGPGIIHGGMATGSRSEPGKLRTPLEPESTFTGNRTFKIDIPLQPGDSGGPVVDAYGNLIGINSAVEYLIPLETAIFIDSEGNRPSTRKIESIIAADRNRNRGR